MWNELLPPLLLSLRVAAVASVACVVIGTPIAWLLARRARGVPAVIEGLILIPVVLPPTVVGYALLVLFARQAPLGRALEAIGIPIVLSWQGAAVASTVIALPLFVLPMRAALEAVDRECEEMAAVLGAGRIATLWHVTLPMARGGLLAGLMLAFARAMGEFGATLMVAGAIRGTTETLPVAIYTAIETGRRSEAVGPVIVLSAVAIGVVVAVRMMRSTH